MTEQEVMRKINEVFEESFEIGRERLVPEAHIFNDLGLDSLDIVDLVVALQKKFGVVIRSDERVQKIRTLGDIYRFISSLGKEGADRKAA
ncbi:MAG: acyl carrier protein [Candidatus Omnitrophica bacterium]|nr:acyl carrier protein [Candidatus Omnitrophota bacterium]